MAMSTDYVEFDLSRGALTGLGVDKAEKLLQETLGITPDEIPSDLWNVSGPCFKVRCRPSQFARFIIRRGELGGHNQIMILNAKLVNPQPVERIVDVIKRSRRTYDPQVA